MYSRLSVDTETSCIEAHGRARALSNGNKRAYVRRDTKVEEDEKEKGEEGERGGGGGDVCVIPERGLLVLPRVSL